MTDLRLLSSYEGPVLSTPNRVALAPMTRNRAGESRVPTEMMGRYYAQRASAGLLISEAVDVSPRAIGYPGTPGLYTDAMVQGWTEVVAAARAAQPEPAPFFAQLFHTGRVSHVSLREDRTPGVAPSAIAAKMQLYTSGGMVDASVPEALTEDGIRETIASFVAAAKGAIAAGFDGVEVNGGNGYLVHQFLSDGANQRTDGYGGSPEARIRFATELVDALIASVGADKVALRISPTNDTNDVTESNPVAVYTALTDALEGKGLAYLHVIETAGAATVTRQLRERFSGTIILNQGYDRASAEEALQEGLGDLVSFGRAFLANPDLPRRLELDADLNEPDPNTFYGGTEVGYTSYPKLG